jgi:indolepyruvate ferredoxin oxidoreductase alpha subunit
MQSSGKGNLMTRRKMIGALVALVAGCAFSVFGKSKHRLKVIAQRCVGCSDCYKICPVENALVMRRGKAIINQTECTSCMLCESVCSYGAIERCGE